MNLKNLIERKLIHPPDFLADNLCYLTIMGSEAYGCEQDKSDKDFYGFCMPSLSYVFPHTAGYIEGFDEIPRFLSWQQHHVKDDKKNYDFEVFSIVHYFRLLSDGNPNIIDSIFTPDDCVQHSTHISDLVRQKRKLFLSKKLYHKFKGYAFSQMKKVESKIAVGKRKELVEKFGYDTKFLSHCYRLCEECRQILEEGDLDIRRSRDAQKAIRRGDMGLQEVKNWFTQKDGELERLYETSTIPHSPDKCSIKELLLNCLEHHYGSIDHLVKRNEGRSDEIIMKIRELIV